MFDWKTIGCITLLGLASFLFSDATFAGDKAPKINGKPTVSKSWDAYTVHYPAGQWELNLTGEQENSARFELRPMSSNEIRIQVCMLRNLPTSDPHYENNPQMFNTSLLLSPALEIAEKDESKIYFGIGTASVPSGWYSSARATILLEDQRAINLEACHQANMPTGHILSAIVVTYTQAGQINSDPAYAEKVREAYKIIQAIEFDADAASTKPE